MPLIWRGGSGSDRPCTPPPPPQFRSHPGPLVPPVFALSLLLGYLCLGAWFFAAWEQRTYLEGFYFTFTALTTIGLTDLGRGGKRPELHLLAVCLYIIFGLIIIATTFALVQEQVITKTRQLAISLGVVKKEELPV